MTKTKIVATIGPACDAPKMIKRLIRTGVSVFRFNLKHNTQQWHNDRIDRVKKASLELGIPVAIMLDLQGPEIRIGNFPKEELNIKKGETVVFSVRNNPLEKTIILDNLKLINSLEIGTKILIDDGYFRFKVTDKKPDKIYAKVLKGGKLLSRKGVNLPGLQIELPTLIKTDFQYLDLAAKQEVDFVALSFVRRKSDLLILRDELKKRHLKADIVAKIENQQAIDNFDEILEETDAVMIARGDLGVEIKLYRLPYLQKEMIQKARLASKPIITATQMLQSMIKNSLPTRAEISDVANAVFDYSDAVMLSGETASGEFPVEAVKVMAETVKYTENKRGGNIIDANCSCVLDAIVFSAYNLYLKLRQIDKKIKAFLVLTESGKSARFLARFRSKIPIIAVTSHPEVRDKLLLTYGIMPFYMTFPKGDVKKLDQVFSFLKKNNIINENDCLIVLHGKHWGEPGKTNTVSVEKVTI